MKKLTGNRRFIKSLLLASLCFLATGGFAEEQDETSGEVLPPAPLGEILPESYINSANYRVNILGVRDDLYQFMVESELGKFKVDSVPLLLKRLREIDVIVQVSNQLNEETDPYADGLQSELKIEGDSAVDLITSPFSAASSFADQLATNLGDTFSGEGSVHEYQQEINQYQSADPIIEMHKRNAASQLGLDVYSRNLRVQQFLNRLAHMRAGGNISAGAKLVRAIETGEHKLSSGEIDRKIDSVIRKYDREELALDNESMMARMKIPRSLRKGFANNPNFSPSTRTAIIYYLESLKGVHGLYEVISVADVIEEPISALGFLQLVKMLSLYHEKVAPLAKLQSNGSVVSAETGDGRLLHFYSNDLFLMDDEQEKFVRRVARLSKQERISRSEIVLYGDISGQARLILLKNNIDYREYFLRRL